MTILLPTYLVFRSSQAKKNSHLAEGLFSFSRSVQKARVICGALPPARSFLSACRPACLASLMFVKSRYGPSDSLMHFLDSAGSR